ncbi:MAG: hypothetical protein GF334_05405 [Candidatus Altiarchaeales archaeon]|nr:hypothetical protein [Candidatus Altiarchaeales archaeon]
MKKFILLLVLCVLTFDVYGGSPYRDRVREYNREMRHALREIRGHFFSRIWMYRRTSETRSESDWIVQYTWYQYRSERADIILKYSRLKYMARRGAPLEGIESPSKLLVEKF